MPPLYDYACRKCDHRDQRVIKIAELDAYNESCPHCGAANGEWHREILTAPSGGVKRDHAAETKALQQSLKERFVKRDLDDMRHKHGSVFDDSLRGAAVDRIKDGKAP